MATLNVKYSVWKPSSYACDSCLAMAGLWWEGSPSRPHWFCFCTIEEGHKTVKLVYKEESRKLVNTQTFRKMVGAKDNLMTKPLKWDEEITISKSGTLELKGKFAFKGGWAAGDSGGLFGELHLELEKASKLNSSIQKKTTVKVEVPIKKRVEVWKTYVTQTYNIKYRVYWEIPQEGGGVRLRDSFQTFTKTMIDVREYTRYEAHDIKKETK